jgi:hypothetical protein
LSVLEEQPFGFESDGLRIEGLLHRGAARLAAVVLHPHPQYSDMHNHVVAAVCQAFRERGVTTLRFNFRGTGRGEYRFDGGDGECADALAAIAALRLLTPGADVVLAGYSFGAIVAARVAAGARLRGLMLISPPPAVATAAPFPPGLETLIITGSDDAVAPPDALAALATATTRVVTVAGADHGWWPGVEVLAAEISQFVAELAPV